MLQRLKLRKGNDMNKYKFNISIDITNDSYEEAYTIVEKYCDLASKFPFHDSDMKFSFLGECIDAGREETTEEVEESNRIWAEWNLKNLN